MTGLIGSLNLLILSKFTRIGTLRFLRKKKRSCNSAQNNDLVQLKAFLDIHHCSFRHWDSAADCDWRSWIIVNLAHSRVSLFSVYVTGEEKGLSWTAGWWKRKERHCKSPLRSLLLPSRLVNRDHKILRQGLLRGRDFLNTKCARVWTTAILAGKLGSRLYFFMGFSKMSQWRKQFINC